MLKKIFFLCLIFVVPLYSIEQEKLDEVIKFINSGKNDTAIEILKSNGGENEILLAIAYLGKKDFDNAKIYALNSYYKDSNNVVVNYILAQIYEEKKEYEYAIQHWEKVFYKSTDKSIKMLAKKHYEVLKMLKK